MNEAEYLLKNYGDLGGCFRDLHNSSYDTKAEFSNQFNQNRGNILNE